MFYHIYEGREAISKGRVERRWLVGSTALLILLSALWPVREIREGGCREAVDSAWHTQRATLSSESHSHSHTVVERERARARALSN